MKNQRSIHFISSIVLVLILSFTSRSVFAQSPNVNMGIKVGASLSTLSTGFNAVTDKSGDMGFNAGIFARVGNKFYVQPELNYATFSNKYTFNATDYKPTFQFINLPLMIGYKVINQEKLALRISAGPDFYYDLKDVTGPVGFDNKRFTAGLAGGVGIDFGNLTLDARYSAGLSKINTNLDQKVNIFSLAIGFRIL